MTKIGVVTDKMINQIGYVRSKDIVTNKSYEGILTKHLKVRETNTMGRQEGLTDEKGNLEN